MTNISTPPQYGDDAMPSNGSRHGRRRKSDPLPIVTFVLSVIAVIISIVSLLVSFGVIPSEATNADGNADTPANGTADDSDEDSATNEQADDDADAGNSVQERTITLDTPIEADADGWHVALTGAVITTGSSGEEIIVIVYEATNNTDDNDSPIFLASTEMYQNGIRLDSGYVDTDAEYYEEYNQIQPGITTTVYEIATLDDHSPVDVECDIDYLSDVTLTATIDIDDD